MDLEITYINKKISNMAFALNVALCKKRKNTVKYLLAPLILSLGVSGCNGDLNFDVRVTPAHSTSSTTQNFDDRKLSQACVAEYIMNDSSFENPVKTDNGYNFNIAETKYQVDISSSSLTVTAEKTSLNIVSSIQDSRGIIDKISKQCLLENKAQT
jgi:hypothetical protein